MRIFHTVENNNLCPLVEYEQLDCYDIGSGGSVAIADLSLVLNTGLSGDLTFEVAGDAAAPVGGGLTDELLLYQDSSGSDYWDRYVNLTDWDGNPLNADPRMQAYASFRGYRTTLGTGNVIDEGDHAAGWLILSDSAHAWTVGVRGFWQNFPKALRAYPDGFIYLALFPDEFGLPSYDFTLRAGEHKTHEVWIVPHPTPVAFGDAPSPLPFGRGEGAGGGVRSLFATTPPAWYIHSGAFGPTALRNANDWPDYESYVDAQLDAAPAYEEWMDWHPNLPAAIERTDFYGLFDYGDWPIDYEGFGVAPLNDKYDYDLGLWLQWARTGDPRWFALAEAADRHFADVDILHNLHSPRHWGDGIAFGHSYHDEAGFLNPHRNYGGASPDTAYGTAGLLLAYYLTGYEKAFDAALELADAIEYRVHNDVHLCDYFPDCSGEGWALMDGLYESGSRLAANNLFILTQAYRATGDARYLVAADAIVDWARPENQPYIAGPTGEDRLMKPWLLNLYLRALAAYLEMRAEFGLPDDHAAAGSYLAYADWLHEYAWIELEPVDSGPRAAYPYEWWFDERQGDPNDENAVGNNIPSINGWLYLGADAMAYAYHLSGDAKYLDWAAQLFRAGSRDPWYEDDANTYSSTKETINAITFGHTFLHEWAQR